MKLAKLNIHMNNLNLINCLHEKEPLLWHYLTYYNVFKFLAKFGKILRGLAIILV